MNHCATSFYIQSVEDHTMLGEKPIIIGQVTRHHHTHLCSKLSPRRATSHFHCRWNANISVSKQNLNTRKDPEQLATKDKMKTSLLEPSGRQSRGPQTQVHIHANKACTEVVISKKC